MSSCLSLAELRGLKRAELQSLCKENSIKANGKTQHLIESLAEHFQSVSARGQTSASEQLPVDIDVSDTLRHQHIVASGESEGVGSALDSATGSDTAAPRPYTPREVEAVQHAVSHDSLPLTEELHGVTSRLARSELSATTSQDKGMALVNLAIREAISQLATKLSEDSESSRKETAKFKHELESKVFELERQILSEQKERLRLSGEVEELRSEVTRLESIHTETRRTIADEMEQGHKDWERISVALSERIQRLESPDTAEETTPEEEEAQETRRAEAITGKSNRQSHQNTAVFCASPALSDAPPTQSLVSFESPVSSPQQLHSTPQRGALAPATSYRGTPSRFVAAETAASTAPTPVSALPPHMIASFTRRSSCSPQSTRTLPRHPPLQPQSPAAPLPNATLGKRARESDASNLSVGLETVGSPPSATPTSNESCLSAPNSAKKEDGHSRKKLRLSQHGTHESLDETDTAVHDVVHSSEEEEEEDTNAGFENSVDSLRDYLMPTKTGDSPTTTFRPAGVSTSDPMFFSAPASPARSTPGRRSGRPVDENRQTPSAVPRKSLPLSNLPFPLVSPFGSKNRPIPPLSNAAATTLSNVSNQHLTSQAKTTSVSARKVLSRRNPHLLAPRTPPASRTLFGTETLAFSDGFEEESKFDDDFETAEEDNIESDETWSRYGRGAFSHV